MDGAAVYHCVRVSIGDNGAMDGPVRMANTGDGDAVPSAPVVYGGRRHLGCDDREAHTCTSRITTSFSVVSLIWKGTAISSASNSTAKTAAA